MFGTKPRLFLPPCILAFLRFFTAKHLVFIQNYHILKDNTYGAKSLLFVPPYIFYPNLSDVET